jgi:hypothetical protein
MAVQTEPASQIGSRAPASKPPAPASRHDDRQGSRTGPTPGIAFALASASRAAAACWAFSPERDIRAAIRPVTIGVEKEVPLHFAIRWNFYGSRRLLIARPGLRALAASPRVPPRHPRTRDVLTEGVRGGLIRRLPNNASAAGRRLLTVRSSRSARRCRPPCGSAIGTAVRDGIDGETAHLVHLGRRDCARQGKLCELGVDVVPGKGVLARLDGPGGGGSERSAAATTGHCAG